MSFTAEREFDCSPLAGGSPSPACLMYRMYGIPAMQEQLPGLVQGEMKSQ